MKKFQEEKENRIKLFRKIIVKCLFVFVFIILSIQIIVSNIISASGDKIQLLEQRYNSLQAQNEILKKQITQVTSLNNLQFTAEKMGFIKNESVVYLVPELNVAKSF